MNTKNDTPPNLASDPRYAAAAAKLGELQADLNTLTARGDAVLTALNNAATNSPRRADAIEAAAYRLLGKDAGASSDANARLLREEFAELVEKKQVLVVAIRLQREVLANLRAEVSRNCIAQVLPTHREMVRNIVDCLVALDMAVTAEHELRNKLHQGDIVFGDLRPMPMPKLGRLSDENSRASAYLIECFEYGFIGLDEVPKHLHLFALAKTTTPAPRAKAKAVATANQDGWHSL